MSTTEPTSTNPYVGPRSFQRGEHLYGRSQETLELLDLLIAGRIVLLHSTSGAGKTSLIEAALAPALENERFYVRPPLRVSMALGQIEAVDSSTNPHILSLLLSLEKGKPTDTQLPLAALAQMTLAEYLADGMEVGDDRDEVWFIDQFEEILTVDPLNRIAKEDFFRQVGTVLRNPQLWALFAMRSEFVSSLDPYLRPVPTRFRSKFRLELLSTERARRAIQEPARADGVEFTDAAATKLINDLRVTRIQDASGRLVETPGPYIEPVQLQVVCHRLWESLPKGATHIAEDAVDSVGDVNAALGAYYQDRVHAIANTTGVPERAIRDWVEQLITAQGIRGQVLLDTTDNENLDNRAVWPLVDAHLVRAENRRGLTWFELAHDRLIEPVLRDNTEWRRVNLNTLQQRARLWEDQSHTDQLLLTGEELRAAEHWTSDPANQLLEYEEVFLAASQKARHQAEIEAEAKSARRLRQLTNLLMVAGLIAAVAAVIAIVARGEAVRQRQAALVQFYASQTPLIAERARDPDLGALLAIEAWYVSQETGDNLQDQIDGSLRALIRRRLAPVLNGHADEVRAVAFSPDGKILATASHDKKILLWNVETLNVDKSLEDHTAAVRAVAFNRDGSKLASTADDGRVLLWKTDDLDADPLELTEHEQSVRSVAFSPRNETLASAGDEPNVFLWDLEQPDQEPKKLSPAHAAQIRYLAFSPDGEILASASVDKTVFIWDMTADEPKLLSRLPSHGATVYGLSFSPDGNLLATASFDHNSRIWDISDPENPQFRAQFTGHSNWVNSVAFSPDGQTVASASSDTTIRLWDIDNPNRPIEILRGHSDPIWSISFSPDGAKLASGSTDKTIRVWNVEAEKPDYIAYADHGQWVRSVAHSPTDSIVASAADDGSVRVWNAEDSNATSITLAADIGVFAKVGAEVWTMALSPNGEILATGDNKNRVRLWDPNDLEQGATATLADHTDWVRSVAFHPNGELLASASKDESIILWNVTDVQESQKIATLTDHKTNLGAVTFHPAGRIMASGGNEGGVMLWDLNDVTEPKVITILDDHKDEINSIAFSPDGNFMASASKNGAFIIYDVTDPKSPDLLKRVNAHISEVNHVAFSPDGKLLASTGRDNLVRLWNVDNPKNPIPLSTLEGHQGWVWHAAFSDDGNTLATSGRDASIRLWDIGDPQHVTGIANLTRHTEWVNAAAFLPDKWTLLSVSDDERIGRWDLSQLESGPVSPVLAVAISQTGDTLAAGGQDLGVFLWDLTTFPTPTLASRLLGHSDSIRTLAFNADDRVLATAGSDDSIRLWNIEDIFAPALLSELTDHSDNVNSVAFSPNGTHMASGSSDETVRVWDVSDPTFPVLVAEKTDPEDWVSSVAFSHDGQFLASGSNDRNILLWEMNHLAAEPKILSAHTDGVRAVDFAPTEHILASGGIDNSILLWDLTEFDTFELDTSVPVYPVRLDGHTDWVWSLDFSPDGGTLFSGSKDATVRQWTARLDDLVKFACEQINHDLTTAQWEQYWGGEPYHKTCGVSSEADRDVLGSTNEQRYGPLIALLALLAILAWAIPALWALREFSSY